MDLYSGHINLGLIVSFQTWKSLSFSESPLYTVGQIVSRIGVKRSVNLLVLD